MSNIAWFDMQVLEFTGAQLEIFQKWAQFSKSSVSCLPKCLHTGDEMIEFSLIINMVREDMVSLNLKLSTIEKSRKIIALHFRRKNKVTR